MYTLIAENQYGQLLELTHNNNYSIKSVIGLDPPDAIINTTKNGLQDGTQYNSSSMDNRTITITLAINYPAELNRINLYRFFKSKSRVVLRYKNSTRNVYITGYTQAMQVAFFDKKQTAQITVLCPEAHFNGAEAELIELSSVVSWFEFPFSIPEEGIEMSEIIAGIKKSIVNDGDLSTGTLIRIHAIGEVVNPQIYCEDTNAYMQVYTTLSAGDTLEIDTRVGHKRVVKTSNGVQTNLIGSLRAGSTWFVLVPGDNIFQTYADENPEYMITTFEIIYQYEGV